MKKGEFQAARRKNKNIARNFYLIKSLNDDTLLEARLMIETDQGFKPFLCKKYHLDLPVGTQVVFLPNNGKGRKLRLGVLIDKDGYNIFSIRNIRLPEKHILAMVVGPAN
jgi:hypothetical protein